jgi:hypothetical protein
VFRHLQLKVGRVELGLPLPPALRTMATSDRNDEVILPVGSFGGAKRITLHLSPTGRVAGATFDYGPDVDFETRVEDYAAMGMPVRSRSADGIESVRWEDDATSFTLRRVPNGDAWLVTAELRDRGPATE